MSDKLSSMISDMETRCLQAKAGARYLANQLCDLKPGDDVAGLIFLAERLEEIVDEIADRRDALNAEARRPEEPPKPCGPLGLVRDRGGAS